MSRSISSATGWYTEIFWVLYKVVYFVLYTGIVFSINVYAGFVVLCAAPLYVFVAGNAKGIMRASEKSMKYGAQISKTAVETFAGAHNVKAKGLYAFFTDKIKAGRRLAAEQDVKMMVAMTRLQGSIGVFNLLLPLLILFLIIGVFNQRLETGSVIVLYIAVPKALVELGAAWTKVLQNKQYKPGLEYLKGIEDLTIEQSGGEPLNAFESLETRGLSVNFGENVITVPDLSIRKGEKVMILGESGKGKSTLFNVILGLKTDYGGEVLLNGRELRRYRLSDVRNVFGAAFQNGGIFEMSLRDNVRLDKTLSDAEIDKLIYITRLAEQDAAKGGDCLNDKMISGGERARISLAATLARSADVLLLDETFSAVDEETEREIVKKLSEHYKDKTVICVSHRQTSAGMFDRVVNFS